MSSGLGATLKLLAGIAVLLLAGIATAFVLDLIPREQLASTAGKALSLIGIAAATTVVLGVLLGKRDGT